MPLKILGLGTAVPPYSIGRDESVDYVAQYFELPDNERKRLGALYRLTGVEKRHSVLLRAPEGASMYERQMFVPEPGERENGGPPISRRMQVYEEQSGQLAVESSRKALESAQLDGKDVTHLVTVSCTGFQAPGWDFQLMRELGLPNTTARTHVGFMGCQGALNGLRVAQGFGESRDDAVVLLCATELCSLHYHFSFDSAKLVANALFADGSAALVARGSKSEPSNGAWNVRATGGCMLPDSQNGMTWAIRDNGFEMSLSPGVPDTIGTHLRPWLEKWLEQFELGLDDIATWAIHPGGPRIVSSAAKSLGLEKDRVEISRRILREYGNMSSPTILFILNQLREEGAPLPCVALAFGPGLVAEAVLFQ